MTTKLRLHHFLVEAAPVHQKVLLPLARKIHADSDGELEIDVIHSMGLGGTPTDLFDQARDGVVDIAWVMPGYSLGRFPCLEVFELPFIMTDRISTSLATWDYAGVHAKDELKGVKLLSAHVLGAGGFHGVSRPVAALEDFDGLRLRAPTQRTFELAEALGARAVMCPPAEMLSGMKARTLDTAMINWDFAGSIGALEIAKFNTDTDQRYPGVYTSVIILVMNEARYERLPHRCRAALDANSGHALGSWIGQAMAGGDDYWRGRAVSLGNTVNCIPAAELARWRDRAERIRRKWVGEMGEAGRDGEAMLDMVRSRIAHYTAGGASIS
jgi:TRAP-type C4-dicarboxylate transport system substrate-binding protein